MTVNNVVAHAFIRLVLLRNELDTGATDLIELRTRFRPPVVKVVTGSPNVTAFAERDREYHAFNPIKSFPPWTAR